MTVLEEASEVVKRRADNYGSRAENFGRVAQIWSGVLNTQITAEQVCLCMVGLKLAREGFRHGRDNLVDMAGYVDCLADITLENIDASTKEDNSQDEPGQARRQSRHT